MAGGPGELTPTPVAPAAVARGVAVPVSLLSSSTPTGEPALPLALPVPLPLPGVWECFFDDTFGVSDVPMTDFLLPVPPAPKPAFPTEPLREIPILMLLAAVVIASEIPFEHFDTRSFGSSIPRQ